MELGRVIESFIGTFAALIVVIVPLIYLGKKKLANLSLFGGLP